MFSHLVFDWILQKQVAEIPWKHSIWFLGFFYAFELMEVFDFVPILFPSELGLLKLVLEFAAQLWYWQFFILNYLLRDHRVSHTLRNDGFFLPILSSDLLK